MEHIVELRPAKLSERYRKKWNVSQSLNDFKHLYVNGKKVNNNLYRVGGFGTNLKADYFELLLQVESKYDDFVTKDPKRKRHLADHAAIIDKYGNVKKVLGKFEHFSYLHGVIYGIKQDFYNIETGELYCHTRDYLETDNFLFLHDAYNEDKEKRVVYKINKKDGTFETFK